MKNFTNDEIYGVDIFEYCKAHNTSLPALILNVKKDIELLEKNFKYHVFENDIREIELIQEIYNTLEKKKRHLKRLLELKDNL